MRFGNYLDELLSKRSYVKLLRVLILNPPTKEWSGRETARAAGIDHTVANDSLHHFNDYGIVSMCRLGNANVYRVNADHLAVRQIRDLFEAEQQVKEELKTKLAKACASSKDILSTTIYDNVARDRGKASSDINLLVIVNEEADLTKLFSGMGAEFGNTVSLNVWTLKQLRTKRKLPLMRNILKDGEHVYGEKLGDLLWGRRRGRIKPNRMKPLPLVLAGLLLIVIFLCMVPLPVSATTENAIPSAIGASDTTGDLLADVQSDDASGASPSSVVLGDGWYTVDKSKKMVIDGFDTSGMSGTVTAATLKVQYSVEAGYIGRKAVEWRFEDGCWRNTSIRPADGEVDQIGSYDLYAKGVDTLAKISTLDIMFTNNDCGMMRDAVSFDYVLIEVTTCPPAAWQVIETWTGTVSAPAQWNLIETWTGTVSAPVQWQLIETWTGTVSAPAAWQLIEARSGTVSAPAAWEVIETWTGTVSAPAEWQLIETWTGTVQAPAAWQLIETWTGTVRTPAPLGQPALYLPADGTHTNDNTPYFEWENGSNANNHRLLVDNDSDFSSPEENRVVLDNNYTIAPENSLPDDNYSWKVIAINAQGENESIVWTFVVDTVAPLAPSLVSPSDGSTTDDTTPTFDWSDVSDPSGVNYTLEIIGELTKTGLISSTYTLTSGEALSDGTYSWRVRAIDGANNVGDWSGAWTLKVATVPPPPPPSPPALATLTVDTTPIKASVYVDNILWGIAPQTRSLAAGSYTISFGDYLGHLTPPAQTVTLVEGEMRTVTGTYTEIPSELIENESSVNIPSITTDENVTIEVENTAITGMTIDVGENVENVRITVQQLTDKPAEIAIGAPGVTYCYLHIVAENIIDAYIDVVLINFKVEKAWIAAENIDPDTIALRRWDPIAEEWGSLPTTRIGDDDTYYYYSAESPGLSIFAVSGLTLVPTPAEFELSDLVIDPSEVGPGETVTISIVVTNVGELEGTCTVMLKIDNVVEATEDVTLAGGATETVTFSVSRDIGGTYNVEVDGLTGIFVVAAQPAPPSMVPLTVTVTGIALLAGILIWIRKRRIGILIWLRKRRKRRKKILTWMKKKRMKEGEKI